MQVIVNGRRAVLKEGASFDYVAENRLFSGSDAYSLSITFPLRDCPENVAVFGRINRSELPAVDVALECELREKRFSRFGVLTVVSISESEIKGQFLEGKSVQNFDKTFDETYINEMYLGEYNPGGPAAPDPLRAWDPARRYVALPWWSVDTEREHNFAKWNESEGKFKWTEEHPLLSYFPYLIYITEEICSHLGYHYDFWQWENHPTFSRLLICNILPPAWNVQSFARMLPHWTVDEYFEKLGLFLNGEFTIDHKAKRVDFAFSRSVLESLPEVRVDDVVSEFSVDIKDDGTDCDYLEAKPLAYKETGHQMQKYYDCGWFVESSEALEYASLEDLMQDVARYVPYWSRDLAPGASDELPDKLIYVKSLDLYFIIRATGRRLMYYVPGENKLKYRYDTVLQPLNEFGRRESGVKEESAEEIEFVPACIDVTGDEFRAALFISCGSYSENETTLTDEGVDASGADSDDFNKGRAQRLLEAGEGEGVHEYFSEIYVAFYDENIYRKAVESHQMPRPCVSLVEPGREIMNPDTANPSGAPFSLSLRGEHYAPFHNIDRRRRYTFKFLADDIPNPRALFHIKGQRYVCEKITATFTDTGMSQLLKGEFFRLADDLS